jgi:signal transduction histidine kinase
MKFAIPNLAKTALGQVFLKSAMSSNTPQRLPGFRWLLQWLCIWTGLLLLPLAAAAQDHISERAWLEDPSGQMTWEEVQQAPFKAYTGTLSKGFGSSAIWLRLRIDAGSPAQAPQTPNQLVLRLRPVYLDDIRVYDPLDPEGLVGITGDQHHPRVDKLQGLSFLVPIARAPEPRHIWLRMVSTSTRQIEVQALTIDDLSRRALTQSLVLSGYVGTIAVIAVWGLVFWLFSREAVVGVFGLAQIAALLYALASMGHLRALWPLHWPAWMLDQITSVFSITAVSAGIGFHVLLLRELTPPRWSQKIHQVMLALLPLKLGMLALGWVTAALQLNMLEVLLAPPSFLLSAILASGWNKPAQRRPALSRPVVIVFYTILVAFLLGASLPGLGIFNGSEIALYIVQLHGLATAFLLLLMLQYRSHVIQKQQRNALMDLERSQLQIQQERSVREEQEKLLAMLAHELKTPLATMSMRLDPHSSGTPEIRRAIRDMNAVIERCQQTSLLGDRQLQVRHETLRMADIVRDATSSCAQPARVELDLQPVPSLSSDRQLLFIVLNNLLENACKYAAPGTPIQLRLRSEKTGDPATENIVLEVANQVGKADWPDADQVFEKYYRSPYARRQAGTGLGLFLVRNLVQTLGGQIDYAPDVANVRFVLVFPTHLADLA